MARQRSLRAVLRRFEQTQAECQRLARDARHWSTPLPAGAGPGHHRPRVSRARGNAMIELAFFRAFLAWESFLEESFVLYALGHQQPRGGRRIHRYVAPRDRQGAEDLIVGEQRFSSWNYEAVIKRADRFFRGGGPFTTSLSLQPTLLRDTKTLRNAVAHESTSARDRFEDLVRRELTVVPPQTTPGSFLNTVKPASAPAVSFLEFYLGGLATLAKLIIRT